MPYALKFYLLLGVAEVAVFLVARWLSPWGLAVNLAFALAAAYLFIIVGPARAWKEEFVGDV